jgi:hypothetical protein
VEEYYTSDLPRYVTNARFDQPSDIELQWDEESDDCRSDNGRGDKKDDDDDEDEDDEDDDDDGGNALPNPPPMAHTDAEAPPRKYRARTSREPR